ncbi:MAG: ABC transporter ATP-binding protein, partial [Culicoidibacterales bacterium]
DVDPTAKIKDITVGMQQRVEILKMLYKDADILIFDEPTAVLTPQEIEELLKIMKTLREQGKSIILITHKLSEIKEVADRCTVIRRGEYIQTVDVANTDEALMAELMVGRKVSFETEKTEANPQEVVLRLKNLKVEDSRGIETLKGVNLELRGGEILGVAGIDGNGQKELVEAITGLAKSSHGEVIIEGKEIQNLSIRERTESGIGHIPEDRHKHGLVLDFSLRENMILQSYYKEPFSKRGFIDVAKSVEYAEAKIEEYDVRSGNGIKSVTRGMSGGNQQKAIIAREMSREPKLLIAMQPTRGLDVGAIEFIHSQLIKERDKGNAVLLISFELEEIMNLSDRIAVMYDGNVIDVIDRKDATRNQLGLLMAGVKEV